MGIDECTIFGPYRFNKERADDLPVTYLNLSAYL